MNRCIDNTAPLEHLVRQRDLLSGWRSGSGLVNVQMIHRRTLGGRQHEHETQRDRDESRRSSSSSRLSSAPSVIGALVNNPNPALE